MPAFSDVEWRVLSFLPTLTLWFIAGALVAVIVIALRALRRAFNPEPPQDSEATALDRRYREGLITLHEYEGAKEKLLQAH